jgi:hypothetical protein
VYNYDIGGPTLSPTSDSISESAVSVLELHLWQLPPTTILLWSSDPYVRLRNTCSIELQK